MGLAAWQHVAAKLVQDPSLKDLNDDQIKALIEVLALVIHADRKVAPIEVAGFNYLFFDLTWLQHRRDLIRQHVPWAADKAAGTVIDPTKGPPVASELAARLSSAELREKVFFMAASLTAIDLRVEPGENEALRWLAEAFGLEDPHREQLFNKAQAQELPRKSPPRVMAEG